MKRTAKIVIVMLIALAANELWGQGGSSIPMDNLECWYPFNGNFNDESGNGRHGTSYGAVITEDRFGNPNACAHFNSNYVVTNWTPPQMEQLTISAWYNITSVGWDNYIVSCGRDTYGPYGGFHMSVYNSLINWAFADGPDIWISASNPDPVSLNNWYHAVYTYDGSYATFYINGQPTETNSYPSSPAILAAPCPLCIGKMGIAFSQGDVWYPWHGWIDDVRIYSDALNPDEVQALFMEGTDEPLPVELSSFTASLTADRAVRLSWISQSETNMWGYRVYRGETPDAEGMRLITPAVYPAANTSTEQVYSHVDNEVETGSTYYYWLEAVEYTDNNLYGPVSVKVESAESPAIPATTMLNSAYPNPFKAGSGTRIELTAKESGTLTIYNSLGQVVRTYAVSPGSSSVDWNGRVSSGNICANGIYLYRLNTIGYNETRKVLLVK